jgi:hypothetical protein
LERIIRAYIEPHIRLCSEPAAHDYVKLLARFITENSELTRRIYSEIFEPVRSLYVAAFAEVLPALPKEPGRLVDQLVGFICAGFLQRAQQARPAARQQRGRRTSAARTASARRNGRA